MRFKKHGFAIAEIVVALFFVTLVIALVGGLGQQVMNFAKRTSQTSAILELRNMTSTISREPNTWLNKMRSSAATSGLYAGCIPDISANVSTFQCPAVMTSSELQIHDSELSKIAGGQYFAMTAPVVDYSGNLIAGTADSPVYLNNEGRICESTNQNTCAFKSIGYFLRSNQSISQNPGSIKFVIKITKNITAQNSSSTPMKNQYLSVEVGESWKKADAGIDGSCPSGTIKLGYLLTGQPHCVNTSDPCKDNEYLIGLNSTGKSVCKTIPTCPVTSQFIALNSSGDDLTCVNTSPCGTGNIFLGYIAGSGEPICHGSNLACSGSQLLVGVTQNSNGSISPQCAEMPATTCADANQKITFNGSTFVCQSESSSIACANNEVMTGIGANGQPLCKAIDETPPPTNLNCGAGMYVSGLETNGDVKCSALPSAANPQQLCSSLGGTWNNQTNKCSTLSTSTCRFEKISHNLLTSSYQLAPGNYLVNAFASIKPNSNNADYAITLALNLNGSKIASLSWASPGDIDGGKDKKVTGTTLRQVNVTSNSTLSYAVESFVFSPAGYSILNFDVEIYSINCQ